MNLLDLPYPSRRSPVVGRRGIVATSQPVAALAGLEMIRERGNAVDAIVATAAALTVVEPTSNGLGSDAFAIVWDGNRLHGLNGSGRAPASLTIEAVRSAGHRSLPNRGWIPVTIPGAVRAWADLHERFGKLPFERVLAPAIALAEDGFAVSPVVAQGWAAAARVYGALDGPEFSAWTDTFAPNGRGPAAGEIVRLPRHAHTLRRIARSLSRDFYAGETAAATARFARETGGYLTESDLATHASTWVEPISTAYRGFDVWEIPPNGQGLAALMALNILEGFDLGRQPRESADAYHLQIEAMKLAFADAHRYIADPEHVDVPTRGLLAKEYAARRRSLIGDQALAREPGEPSRGGTVYLCAADTDGVMVSYIQSNYQGFGSGVVIPGTGIALQNRGFGFRLDPDHPNALAPGKRPFHTIIPAFLTRDGAPIGPFGVMGGPMQPQGHVQVVVNTVDYAMNPQAALDAPRWQVTQGLGVELEHGVARNIVAELARRGHEVNVQHRGELFGKGQIIWRGSGPAEGSLIAGSEPRCDGCAIGY